MAKITAQQQQAAEYIQAADNHDGTVTYHDDAMQTNYRCDYADLDRLSILLNSQDEYTARNAYSLWCAEFSHAEAPTVE